MLIRSQLHVEPVYALHEGHHVEHIQAEGHHALSLFIR